MYPKKLKVERGNSVIMYTFCSLPFHFSLFLVASKEIKIEKSKQHIFLPLEGYYCHAFNHQTLYCREFVEQHGRG